MAAFYTPPSDQKNDGQAEHGSSLQQRRNSPAIVIEDPSHSDPSANAARTPVQAWSADRPPLPAPSTSPRVGNGHTPNSAHRSPPRAAPESAPPASRRQKICNSVCAEVKEFLGDWFGAEDMANAALGPFLCGCTDGGKSDDDDESELPMAKVHSSPSNRKALHEARQRFVNMPHIDILEAAFKMEEVHVERIKPFTEGQCHGGWKMLMQQCDNFYRYICTEGKTKALSLEQTKEFFQLVGHHFFNEDLSYLLAKGCVEPPTGCTREQLERDVCERFDLDGSHDLNFLEAFKCLRHCIEKKLKDEGHLQLRKVPSRSPEQSGYKRIKETARGNQVSAYLADSESAFLQDARSQGKVVVNMYRKKGKPNPHRIDELAEDLEFCTRLQTCDYVRRVYEIFQDNKYIYTVVDPMKGDLTQLRRKAARMDVPLTAAYFRTIFKQCLEGVNHIHEHGLIHGDLKELNVMLATKDISSPLVKIVDIGVGVTANQTNPSGTPGYRPPEVNETGVWYPKGDIFSLGVMFFQLLADRTPNMEKGKLGIFQKGAKLQTFQTDIANITRTRPVPVHLIEIEHSSTLKWLPSMMEKNRRMRPMSIQLLAYPWFDMSDEEFEKAGRKLRQAGDTDDEGKSLLDNMESFGISAFTSIVSSKVEGESQEDVMMESEIFPFFILAQTFVAALLWFITVHMEAPPGQENKSWVESLGGLDRFFAGDTVLLLQLNCEDYRWQVWRWVTYQFSHVGISHIGTNCMLNLLLGIPLEKLHGSLKAFIMYNVGVAGGALCYIVGDARNAVVGMSGGCYSLVGLHAAYTVINWAQRKYRKVVLMILALIVAIDVSLSVGLLDYKGETKPSNSAHLGGATAGLVIGIILGNNLHVKQWEIVLKWAMVATGIALVIFCLAWNMQWAPAPIQDTDFRFCWYRQVYNATLWDSGDKSYWRCVRCTDQACIDSWSKQEWIADATREECSDDIGWYN